MFRLCVLGVLTAGILLLGLRRAEAARVVLAPLDPHSVAFDTARSVSSHMAKAISSSGVDVWGESDVARAFRLDLREHLRMCAGDVFCLTELGTVLEAQRLIFGRLTSRPVSEREGNISYELRLSALDVRRAKIVETLVWRIEVARDQEDSETRVEDMAAAAARRLACPPDLRVAFFVEPSDAVVRVYGERFKLPPDGRDVPYWSGQYEMSFERRGYVPQALRLSFRRSGIVRRVEVLLEADPLFTEGRPDKPVELFSETSRRSGSGVSSLDVARASSAGSSATETGGSERLFRNPYPWAVAAAGVGMLTAGLVLRANAQADYNALAEDVRFLPGVTPSAEAARGVRSDALSSARTGTVLALVGVASVVGGLMWLAGDGGWFGTSHREGSEGPPDVSLRPRGQRPRPGSEWGGILSW
ncbi:MAG: hypothetical protein IPK13_24890 [Deltaproteobacteria bacterium]|nr:hypothetical protein [Deltaproteobacteria bacterium]